ncbi:MAG TPA: hypothetical protein PK331_11245 [Gordonia sp. (in: high G+C Gram-positive bacteria)]|nr:MULTISPECIES: hypothetical protein [unclassified Gordonia (in: high G+C Gram-positive bacteria)]HNP57929.1 hypothetical protein [Gordonia sp. (in: high G+C Gram-positive bacteria)]HRC51477.1 hypothetical protein [Gordonia sp. (in: high G+C Gram-positive bacteria)]
MRHYHVNRRDEEWRRRHNNKRRFPNPLPQQGHRPPPPRDHRR